MLIVSIPSVEVMGLCSLLFLNCGDDTLFITGITETGEASPGPIGEIDNDDWCDVFGPVLDILVP